MKAIRYKYVVKIDGRVACLNDGTALKFNNRVLAGRGLNQLAEEWRKSARRGRTAVRLGDGCKAHGYILKDKGAVVATVLIVEVAR